MNDGTDLAATDPNAVRKRDRTYVWHTWSPLAADRTRLTVAYGEGYRLWDIDGREYLDASSLNSICGYGHPEIVAAAQRQLSRLHGVDISVASHELTGMLAERLASYLPPSLSRTLFVNSGSEGFEAAVLIAKDYFAHCGENRSRVVTLSAGYHGATLVGRSLSGLPRVGHPYAATIPVTHVDLPLPPRELRKSEGLSTLLAEFERALGDDHDDPPMAVIVEPFLNLGGGVVMPPGFLAGLRRLCDQVGALLILDEVFTGYGRTGRMFAFQREDATPDILVSSKGLGGGYVPIAAVTVTQSIYESYKHEPVIGGLRYGHTTSGHAVACAAGLATFDVLDKDQLPARGEQFGAALLRRLGPLIDLHGVVDVRSLGLLLVVEMDSFDAAAAVIERAHEAGLLMRQQGSAVMAVPPLTIDEAGIDELGDKLGRAVVVVCSA